MVHAVAGYIEVAPVKMPGTGAIVRWTKQLVVNNIRLPWPVGEQGEDLLKLVAHSEGAVGGYASGWVRLVYTGEMVENPDWDPQDDQPGQPSGQWMVPPAWEQFDGRVIGNVKVVGIGGQSVLAQQWLCMADAGFVLETTRAEVVPEPAVMGE